MNGKTCVIGSYLATIWEPILLLKSQEKRWVLDDTVDPQESTLPLHFLRSFSLLFKQLGFPAESILTQPVLETFLQWFSKHHSFVLLLLLLKSCVSNISGLLFLYLPPYTLLFSKVFCNLFHLNYMFESFQLTLPFPWHSRTVTGTSPHPMGYQCWSSPARVPQEFQLVFQN